ncbi:MAG: cell shape-determining protein, partial [Deltaproteobacteria bacterium]|nr:cell shape-determining protein [Deltaproteobacteria bacterium]
MSTAVTLTGSGFTGTTAVDFTSAPGASFTLVSDTQIDTTVPVGATTGTISVTNSAGTGVGPTFTIEVVPTLTSLAP